MADATTATLVVQYGAADKGNVIKAEVDEEKHSSSSQFSPGEEVYFRIYANCNYSITLSDSGSSFSQQATGKTATIKNKMIEFIQSKTASLSYPYKSGWSFEWIGSPPKINGSTLPKPSEPAVDSTEVKIQTSLDENKILAVGLINSYDTKYDLYKLTPGSTISSRDQAKIVVFIAEEAS